MSLSVRIIPCLDVTDGRVVKGVNFTNLQDAGDPVEMAALYGTEGADELTFLDISASVAGRETTLDDVDRLLRAGADKVSINTAAIARPELIAEIADRFGSQVLVISIDARRARTDSGFEVTTHGGRQSAGLDALSWVEKACELGVGEILLNSMDADGTRAGYDIGMITAVRAVSKVPLIASGGAGSLEDFAAALDAGADALLAASVFHFGIHRIGDVKKYLGDHNYSVRNAHTA